jgi:hypothetical protein
MVVSFRRENDADEARAIVQAMRALQANPELVDDARGDLPGTLDRLGLSGTARHAVAATLALGVTGVILVPGSPIFWAA